MSLVGPGDTALLLLILREPLLCAHLLPRPRMLMLSTDPLRLIRIQRLIGQDLVKVRGFDVGSRDAFGGVGVAEKFRIVTPLHLARVISWVVLAGSGASGPMRGPSPL